MNMGEVSKLSAEDKKKWSLHHRLKSLLDTAKAADQGHWSRSHSVVESWDKSRKTPTVVCLAEGFGQGSYLNKHIAHAWQGDPTKEFPNTRHIVNCSPRSIVRLIECIYELLPELKNFD